MDAFDMMAIVVSGSVQVTLLFNWSAATFPTCQ
jgi:hypothetical protein